MDTYDVVRSLLRVLPLALIPLLLFATRRVRPLFRYPMVLGLGWLGLFASVILFWNYSIGYAPTEQIGTDLARRDGGPVTFAFFFGWLFVGLYMCALEVARFVVVWSRRRLQSRTLV